MTDQAPRHINILDIVAFVIRWKRFLLGVVLSITIAVAIVSFVVKPRYRSTAIVRSAEPMNSGLSGLIASKLSSLGGIGGFLPSMGEVPGELFETILNSRWMFERLVERFNLRDVYGLQKAPDEDVIKMAESRTRTELQLESESILITVDDESRERSLAMAQFLVDELDLRYQELRSTNARREREYLSQRLDESKIILTALEDSLAGFQQKTGMLDPQEQAKATLNAVASVEAQKLAAEVELQMNRFLYVSSTEPGEMQLRLASIDSTLQRMLQGESQDSNRINLLLNIKDAPREAIQFVRIKRDIEIQQILVAVLVQQFEQAKLEEKRNTPTLMRLDPPVLATKRAWPRRGLMVGAAAFGALVFGSLLAALVDYLGAAARNPNHPQHDRVQAIRKNLTRAS